MSKPFRLELRDDNFVVKEILDAEYQDLNWAYSSKGGCGEINFTLPRKRFEEKILRSPYNLRVYYRNPATNVYDLWYQGFIQTKSPRVQGNDESIAISGHGYVQQLSHIYLNNITYTSQEVSVIVKAILDTYVTPYTDVSYSVSDLEATTFTPASIQFNETVLSAMQKLADLVGGIEWGVDKNRNFFFKAKSTTVGHRFYTGAPYITEFTDDQDFTEIINYVIVQGAQAGGTYFTAGPYEDALSQSKYGLRQKIIQNSSIVTSDVASQFANAVLDEQAEVTRKASCSLIGWDAQIEATNPIPLFVEISRKVKYGQKKYGTFLYSGLVYRRVNRVNYRLNNNGGLKISLNLDHLQPLLSEQIGQIEYNLEQQRSAAL